MKHLELVKHWARINQIDLESISFYRDMNGDQIDSEYTYCEITNQKTNCGRCMARSLDGNSIHEFNAADDLIAGALGKLAGAF